MNKFKIMAERMAELTLSNLRQKILIPKLNLWKMTGQPDQSCTTPFITENPYEPKVDVKINFLNDEVKE